MNSRFSDNKIWDSFDGLTSNPCYRLDRGYNITRGLTSVCTMWGLWSLRLLTVWNTSRMPSAFTLSRTVLSAQKVPVRPAPALYEINADGERGRKSKSKQYMKMTMLRDLTCSALWWGGFLTAAVVSAPLRLNWSCLCRRWGCPPLANHGNGTGALLGPCSPENVGKGI